MTESITSVSKFNDEEFYKLFNGYEDLIGPYARRRRLPTDVPFDINKHKPSITYEELNNVNQNVSTDLIFQ